jgi:hypothetical protein
MLSCKRIKGVQIKKLIENQIIGKMNDNQSKPVLKGKAINVGILQGI